MQNRCNNSFWSRHRKLMVVIVLLLAIVSSGSMALALGGNSVDADARARAEALNEQLGKLLAKVSDMLFLIDPDIGSYVFAADGFTQKEYDDLSARIEAVEKAYFHFDDNSGEAGAENFELRSQILIHQSEESLTAVWNLLRRLDLKKKQPTDEIILFVEEALKEAGYAGYRNRTYTYTHWIGVDDTYSHGWNITASNGEQSDNNPGIQMRIFGDDQIDQFGSPFPGFIPTLHLFIDASFRQEDPLTAAEKQTLKDHAAAFYEQYMYNQGEKAEIVLVSDHAFADLEGHVKPYGAVWIYAPAAHLIYNAYEIPSPMAPFNKENPSANQGVCFQIELETGNILSVTNPMEMSQFANNANAKTDWEAITGQEYPVRDEYYVRYHVIPEIRDKYQELAETYHEALTDDELFDIYHMLHDSLQEGTEDILLEADWVQLREDLHACDSLEAFQAILHTDYLYFNQSPPGEPTREETMAAAMRTLEALGYKDLKLYSFLYCGAFGCSSEFHDIFAANTFDRTINAPNDTHVLASINAEGKVRYLQGGVRSASVSSDPVTEAEQKKVADTVWKIAVDYLGFGGVPVEGSVRVGDKGFRKSSGDLLVRAIVLFNEAIEAPEPSPDTEYTCAVMMTVNALDGRVEDISLWGSFSEEDLNRWL